MKGWATDISPDAAKAERQVVAVFAADKFPEPDLIREILAKGLAHDPETVFVVRQRDALAVAAVSALGHEPVIAGLNPHWKYKRDEVMRDDRRSYRQSEMLNYCNKVVVFTTPTTKTLKDIEQSGRENVYVISRGKRAPAKRRQGRKPTGA